MWHESWEKFYDGECLIHAVDDGFFFLFCKRSSTCGEMPMLYALMWIAQSAWTKGLMSWQSFVELERLSRNGLQGLVTFYFLFIFIFIGVSVGKSSKLVTTIMAVVTFVYYYSLFALPGQ